ILEAGLRGGLGLNYGCSNGNCGLCKIRVLSGEVRPIRHHDFCLTQAEKSRGYVLACSCTAVTDVVLEADEARDASEIPQQSITTRIKKVDSQNGDVILLSLQTPRTNRLRFLAGQNAELSLEDGERYPYPIASCPCDDRNLQFHIPVRPDNNLIEYLLNAAKNKDPVIVTGPSGNFTLNEASARSLVFIAEDTGFASIKGLIEHAMALDSAESILLFWYTQDADHPYLHNLCRAWNDALDNFEYFHFTLNPKNNWMAGFEAPIQQQQFSFHEFDYYISAGVTLTTDCENLLISKGVPKQHIHRHID
ncbi:MAG: 2Fe-2S iron-sulfur cluster-binding protein, partial [Pseudomonadota bacterium]